MPSDSFHVDNYFLDRLANSLIDPQIDVALAINTFNDGTAVHVKQTGEQIMPDPATQDTFNGRVAAAVEQTQRVSDAIDTWIATFHKAAGNYQNTDSNAANGMGG